MMQSETYLIQHDPMARFQSTKEGTISPRKFATTSTFNGQVSTKQISDVLWTNGKKSFLLTILTILSVLL